MVNGSISTSGTDLQVENSNTAIYIPQPERDILSSPYDELALLKKRISFSDLAASTQDIICAENPAFERSSFGAWDFFIWGSLADLEALASKAG